MRLLVVEDEHLLAQTLLGGLTAEGYAVDLAADGREGLSLARRYPYAAIVLDVMLPGLNGYRVCGQLRKEGISTPVLVLTAKDGEYDEAEALDTGADDYLAKPFSYVVLLARLRALIRRGGSARGNVLRLGDLWVDVAARRCGREATEVPLTAKEFAVLECLARRPGEIVSKTEILDEVWDANFNGDVNNVEVYVSGLRRKLDRPFGRSTIHTMRGAGYRMVDDRA